MNESIRGYTIEETGSGIYTIKGDILPMQVIDSRKLSVEENIWLKRLRGQLNMQELEQLNEGLVMQGKDARVGAYANAILQANMKTIQEATQMYSMKTLEKAMKEAGWTAQWEAQGRTEGQAIGRERTTLEIARKMKEMGDSVEKICAVTGLSFETIKQM